jgi:hypothetical protein
MTNSKLSKKNINKKQTKKSLKVNKLKGGSATSTASTNNFVFKSQFISSQPNTDSNYKEIGIIHITEKAAINIIKGFATGVAGIFGRKGFDTVNYDIARNKALTKIVAQINTNTQRICNLRMDIEGNPDSFFIHLYGTLLEKRK